MDTQDEMFKKLEEYGQSHCVPFHAKDMLRRKVPIARLGGHRELREYVEDYRRGRQRSGHAKGWSEYHFRDHGNLTG